MLSDIRKTKCVLLSCAMKIGKKKKKSRRAFFMEMKELLPSKHLADPLCSRKEGIPPKQTIDINEFDAKINKAATAASVEDMDEEFYGSEEFNEDEFDEEGFDDLKFE